LRIFLLLRGLGFGGAERQLVHLAQGLARRGHQVTVATFYGGGPFECDLSEDNVEILPLGKMGRWDLLHFFHNLLRALEARQPDVIYSFLPAANILAAAARAVTAPRSALVWGIRGTPLDVARYGGVERASIWLEQLTRRAADLVIANSQAGAAWAGSGPFGAKRVAMIANGIDAETFRPASPDERIAARAALGCPLEGTIVAVVARLDPMKDHATFLRAFAILSRAAPGIRALIVGEGPPATTEELHRMADVMGIADRVIWAGARRDVRQVYHAADILCLPSAFGEGFPNVVGEAMASGLRCVVTAVGECARLVGDTGLLAPPGSPEALARALLDSVQPLGKGWTANLAARERIIQYFGVGLMVSATERRLKEVVDARARRRVPKPADGGV
jgi:glycosyltransferase involved in cell wall biosynthesis